MNYKHGHTYTPTWNSWKAMIRRCKRGNSKSKWYSDRGIGVCYRWKDFNNFLADMGERPYGMTLDRIDNNKGYQPDNCRWATRQMQAANKRTNVLITANGETHTANEWSRKTGIQRQTLIKRFKAGHCSEKILSQTKINSKNKPIKEAA